MSVFAPERNSTGEPNKCFVLLHDLAPGASSDIGRHLFPSGEKQNASTWTLAAAERVVREPLVCIWLPGCTLDTLACLRRLRLATTSMDSSGHCPQTDPAVQGDPDAETEGHGRKGDGDHGGTGSGVEKGDGARDKGDGGKKLGVLPVGS